MERDRDPLPDSPPEDLEWRSLVLLGIGAALAVLSSLVRGDWLEREIAPAGDVAVWAADRGAGAVYGLDENGIVARVLRVESPLRLASAGDVGVWIVRSREAHARAGHDLVLARASGGTELAIEIDRCADLAATARGDALCIEIDAAGCARATRTARDGAREVLAEDDSFTAIAGIPSAVAIGTSRGELLRIDAGGARSCALVARSIVALAPGPRANWVWVLDGGREVVLVDARDAVVWRAPTGLDARQLAPVAGEEWVWVCDAREPRARRIARAAEDVLECGDLGASAPESIVGGRGRGILAAFSGAIVCRDGRGRVAPGQGGFHTLVDLERR